MRHTFIILTVLVMLVACSNSGMTKDTANTEVTEHFTDTTQNNRKRQILIKELKELNQTIASNDKERIANIFPFPLSDSAFSIYVDDTIYYQQFKANGNQISKPMFLQYFKEIAAGILADEVKNLFKHINVDSLLYKDTLKYNAYSKAEPCYYSYEIDVMKNSVTLRMDMNSNTDYQSNQLSEDGIPENSSEICEHAFWWIFKFDGQKLNLEGISGAD